VRIAERDGGLEALLPGDRPRRGLVVDWGRLELRGLEGQPLVRALGGARSVLDATAGLGYDAFLIAATGRTVVAVERCEPVFRLLADARRRAVDDARLASIAGRIAVVQGDARERFGDPGAVPEAIYLDPMFPPKRRAAALPPKEMQVVRALAGEDPDAEELLAAARASGARVILKRPRHAAKGPCDFALGGKLARFEVYLPKDPSASGRGTTPAQTGREEG
jgi:16S rRNA (guanine1516-N2)-methyltransferase